jgi:biotin--protein ligase
MSPDLTSPAQDILIYRDEGVGPCCFKATVSALARYLRGDRTRLRVVNADFVCRTGWETSARLFVLPGGADIPYDRKLHGAGCANLRKFVEAGGHFLGICAGGYFGGLKVEFAMGTELQVEEDRELGFFPGTVAGPVLRPYAYFSDKGACAATVTIAASGDAFASYHNGGGRFAGAENLAGVRVLATYADEGDQPAIVRCAVGRGSAVLSGVHLEFGPGDFPADTDVPLGEIEQRVAETNARRIKFIAQLFEAMGISPNDNIKSARIV